jgi:phosphomannomutase/phosphoglucomutase
MIKIKSRKSAAAGNEPATPSAANLELKALLPGLGVAVCGLLAALVLIWFGMLQVSHQQQQEQMIQAWGGAQASVIQQGLVQLSNDTQRAASNPQLLRALLSDDPALIAAAERSLLYLDGIVDAQLNLSGKATQNNQRAAPMNFAALDLVRRAESGQAPTPEAYKVGERWVVYSVAPIRAAADQPAMGTLLLAVDLQRLLGLLPAMPETVGQFQATEQFDSGPAQLLYSAGQAATDTITQLPTKNPHWKFSFTPGTQLTDSAASPLILLLAALLALAGALLGMHLVLRNARLILADDADKLQQMVRELASGKLVKSFNLTLPALNTLGKQLAELPQRKTEPASQAVEAEPRVQKPVIDTSSIPGTFDDILDIDIIDELPDDLAPEQAEAPTASVAAKTPELPSSIFRAYDIRGVVGSTLTSTTAYWIGRAIGSQSIAQGESSVVVARDGRLSGPELSQALIQGLVECGCRVIDIGMVPTPVLYFATNVLDASSGVMVTGSHNPPDYNGFKIVIAGDTLANESITALHTRIQQDDLVSGNGSLEQQDMLDSYFRQIRDDIAIAKNMKVVVDCGNGVAGVIAPRLIEALGCTVIPLFCEVDGNFPNHHPDPGKLENLQDLIARVKEEGADLGLAFDGDGDRVGVVTNTGDMIYPDRLMMVFAKDVVSRNPGADVIFDVKCSRRLGALISSYGGRPVMWKTGHSLIKKKMKETGALLAGEMSGHIFFKERWYGFDDGIYSAARLLEILSLESRDAEKVFGAFPASLSTPEINITVTDENKFALIERLQSKGQWGDANLTLLDGVRVDYPKGWGLVRASNTTPVLVLRFEADTQEELERIQEIFRAQLQQAAPELNLTF